MQWIKLYQHIGEMDIWTMIFWVQLTIFNKFKLVVFDIYETLFNLFRGIGVIWSYWAQSISISQKLNSISTWTGMWICCLVYMYLIFTGLQANSTKDHPYLLIIPKYCPRNISLEWIRQESVIDEMWKIFQRKIVWLNIQFADQGVSSVEKGKFTYCLDSLFHPFRQAAEYLVEISDRRE